MATQYFGPSANLNVTGSSGLSFICQLPFDFDDSMVLPAQSTAPTSLSFISSISQPVIDYFVTGSTPTATPPAPTPVLATEPTRFRKTYGPVTQSPKKLV